MLDEDEDQQDEKNHELEDDYGEEAYAVESVRRRRKRRRNNHEAYEAYATMDKQRRSYTDSRKKLKEIQKSRGFFRGDLKGELNFEERKQAAQKEKARKRCASCGKIGHCFRGGRGNNARPEFNLCAQRTCIPTAKQIEFKAEVQRR